MSSDTLRVLYVDDTESQRYAISRMLTSSGYTVSQGATGAEGIHLAREVRPDIIVLDVQLPDIDGFEVCRRLKSDAATRDIPILQVSASFTSPEHKATALDSGADGYLTTPFNSLELTANIRALIRARRAREDAEREYRNMRAVFDTAMDAMVIWDEKGKFLDVNPSACTLFGLSRDQLIGKSVEEFLADEDRASVIPLLRPTGASTGSKGEFRLRDNSGTEHFIEFTATVDFLPGRHLSVMRDITERKRNEREIREFNQTLERKVEERTAELQETNRELEAFSYSVSHDLRAPFRHIAGFAQLLQKHIPLDQQAIHYVQTISDAAKHAGNLVDDLLAFSRMARSELRLRIVSMDGIVAEIMREIAVEIEGRQINWKIHRLGAMQGDGDMLKVAIRNLIVNAVKYTNRREVAEIEIGVEDRDRECVYFVRDNGVGFNMKFVNKLFGVFQRLHSMEEFEGTGIGLANVRRIVQRHGGRVWAEGEIDHGATFFMALPKTAPAISELHQGNYRKQEQSSGGTQANTTGGR
jgi:PAS domain S-box-containing protein